MSGKFDDIPTEPLFGDDEYRTQKRRARTVKSVAQGKCPHCTVERMGVIRVGKHWVWRTHNKRTWSGVPMECMASGVAVCAAPERVPLDPSQPLRCPHG
jgi:DNA-binding helix-hairpin-helix protein with protein kinase domain